MINEALTSGLFDKKLNCRHRMSFHPNDIIIPYGPSLSCFSRCPQFRTKSPAIQRRWFIDRFRENSERNVVIRPI